MRDSEGRTTEIVMTAGHYGDVRAPAPPPASWASHADSDVAIWTIKLAPHARCTLPAAPRHATARSTSSAAAACASTATRIPHNHRVELRARAGRWR